MQRRQFLQGTASLASIPSYLRLISHASAQTANDTDSLLIGCTAAMTGPLGGFGQNMRVGVDAALAQINSKGGIHGRPIKFEVLDDAYQPARSVENAKRLLDNGAVLGLMACLGTPNNAAITPLIEASGTPHLAPLTGASSLRKPEFKNTFHVRASYTDEITRLVESLVSMGIRDLAIVYLDNPYGKEVLGDATKALNAAGIRALAQVALATDGKNLEAVAKAVLDAKPSAVLLGTAGAATTGLVATLKKASPLLPIAGVSASLTQDGIRQLGKAAQGMAMTMVFPDPNRAKHQVIREYQAGIRAMGQEDFNTGSLEGFINTRIMAEALNRAGRNPTRAKLGQALASLRNYDLGGFAVSYGGTISRVGSKFVDLGVLSSDGKFRS